MTTQRLCVVCASPIQGRPQKLYCGETCIKRAYRARHGLVHPRPLGRLRRLEAERDSQAQLIARYETALAKIAEHEFNDTSNACWSRIAIARAALAEAALTEKQEGT